MREYKFRAWNKAGGVFIKEENIYYYFERFRKDANIVLMQFTGINDQNGKELYYDSDIVKLETGEIAIATKDDFDCPWWVIDGFPVINFIDYFNKYSRQGFEIIGNKFEHPELRK